MKVKVIINGFYDVHIEIDIIHLPNKRDHFLLNRENEYLLYKKLWTCFKENDLTTYADIKSIDMDCCFYGVKQDNNKIDEDDFDISAFIIVQNVVYFQNKDGTFDIYINLVKSRDKK